MFFTVFNSSFTIGDLYLTAQASSNKKAQPIKLTADGSEFIKYGTFGNFTLKVATEELGGFVRVDIDDKKLYSFSKINANTPVEEKQASRFQLVILSDYELKLFALRPSLANKASLAAATIDEATLKVFQTAIESYNDMSKEDLTQEEATLLVSEFAYLVQFITQGSSETAQGAIDKTAYTAFVNAFDASIATLILALQKMHKGPEAAQVFLNAVKSWDFGFTIKVDGAPANNDIVVIFSESAQKYFAVVKDKGLDGKDVYNIAATADDAVSASQFRVQEIGGRVGFICASELGKDLTMISITPTFNSDVASVQRKLSRLALGVRNDKPYGQPGTEGEQFQISGSAGSFSLRNAGVENVAAGFLTVDANDGQNLRVFDYDKTAKVAATDKSQAFKFLTISASKDFYDAMSKARAEKNLTARLEIYAQQLSAISSIQSATILLTEVKKMMQDNKTSATQWDDFTKNFKEAVVAFVVKLNEGFAESLKISAADQATMSNTDKAIITVINSAPEEEKPAKYVEFFTANSAMAVKYPLLVAQSNLLALLAAPFMETLADGNFAIAWIDKDGNKKFLIMEEETIDKPAVYSQFYKIAAKGTDPLNPASIFNLKINQTNKTIQLESEFNRDAVTGKSKGDDFTGPNDELTETEGVYSAIKIADFAKETTAKYLRIYAWREFTDKAQATPADQKAFNFAYEGSAQSMSFRNESSEGYVVVDSTDFTLRTLNDGGTGIEAPGQNGKFILMPVNKQQMEMAKIRKESITKQVEFYSKMAETFDAKSAKDLRELFVDEVSKFVGRVVSTPSNFADAKTQQNKMDLLMAAINDNKKVATYKTVSDKAAKIRETWQAGFSGAFENDQVYALSFKDASGVEKILRAKMVKVADKFIYKLEAAAKTSKTDELEPLANFKAKTYDDGDVSFSLEIGTGEAKKTYTLSVKDNPTTKKSDGLEFKEFTTPVLAENATETEKAAALLVALSEIKFLAVKNSDDGTVSLQSRKTSCGFVAVGSADADAALGSREVSTLSELSKEAAGLRDADNNLIPSEYAKFTKAMLAPIHKELSKTRSITDDLKRLEKYIEFSNYKKLPADQNESITAEVVSWVKARAEVKKTYDTLSANKAFTSKLIGLLDKAKTSLPEESVQRAMADAIKELWLGGFVGTKSTILPEAGKKILLMVNLKLAETDSAEKPYFLRAVKNDEYEKIILTADSLTSMDEACLFEIMLQGGRVGFKSNASDGKILMHTVAESAFAELIDATPRAREIATALSFVDAELAKFDQKTPSGAQFVLDAAVTAASAVNFKELTTSGFLHVDVDKETVDGKWLAVVRALNPVINPQNPTKLESYDTAGKTMALVVATGLYDQALAATKETDKLKQINLFKALLKIVKIGTSAAPITTDKMIFLHALEKAFRDQPDFTAYKYLPEITAAATKAWKLVAGDAQLKLLEEIKDSTLVIGNDYVKALLTNSDIAMKKGDDQGEKVKRFISEQLAIWREALDAANWKDEKIKADLKLSVKDDAATIKVNEVKIFKERINAYDKILRIFPVMLKGLQDMKKLTPQEQADLKKLPNTSAQLDYLLKPDAKGNVRDANGKLSLKLLETEVKKDKAALVKTRPNIQLDTPTTTPLVASQ